MKLHKNLTKTGTPPAVRLWSWTYVLVFFGPPIGLIVAGLFDKMIVLRVMTSHNGMVYVPGYMVWVGLWTIVLKWRERRLVRRVIESDRQACPRCTYDLRGLPSEHNCPECGFTFEIEAVRSMWVNWPPVGCKLDPPGKRQRLTEWLMLIAAILIAFGIITWKYTKQVRG